MPTPLTINPATLTSLKVATTDAIKLQLLLDKVPGNPAQTIDLGAFAARYGTTEARVSAAIQALQTADAVRTTYSPFTVMWNTAPTTSATAAQIQSDWNNKILDDPTYYVYQALVLTKPAGAMTQTVDPATFSAAPWNIMPEVLVREVQTLAARKPTNAAPDAMAPFGLDFGTVGITWIAADIGNAA